MSKIRMSAIVFLILLECGLFAKQYTLVDGGFCVMPTCEFEARHD